MKKVISRTLSGGASDRSGEISAEASLTKSREEIWRITKEILDLANARQKVSLQISRDKVLLGHSIANPEVEKKLLFESINYAKSVGLDENLARALALDLIKFSKIAQSTDVYKDRIKEFLASRKIMNVSIVGAGRMGAWFAKYFQELSVKVFFYDERLEKARDKAEELGVQYFETLEKVVKSDLVIVSVPISTTPKLIRQLSEWANGSSDALNIMEISSVKNEMGLSGLLEERAMNEKIALYSVHPLFGSSSLPFEMNSIIQSFPKDTAFITGLFPHFTIVFLDWKEHDRLMGVFLTLPHTLALVFADVARSEGKFFQKSLGLNAPSYQHMLELSRKVLSEDPEIYFEIQASNPNSKSVLSDLKNSLLRMEKVLKSRSEYVEFFEKARHEIDGNG